MNVFKHINHPSALKVAIRILSRWSCNQQQINAILDIDIKQVDSISTNDVCLSCEQILRISYIVNIHSSLSCIFKNHRNIYGFMSMKNNNKVCQGRSPLQVIETGDMTALADVYNEVFLLKNRPQSLD